jgi:hypothetical protein
VKELPTAPREGETTVAVAGHPGTKAEAMLRGRKAVKLGRHLSGEFLFVLSYATLWWWPWLEQVGGWESLDILVGNHSKKSWGLGERIPRGGLKLSTG